MAGKRIIRFTKESAKAVYLGSSYLPTGDQEKGFKDVSFLLIEDSKKSKYDGTIKPMHELNFNDSGLLKKGSIVYANVPDEYVWDVGAEGIVEYFVNNNGGWRKFGVKSFTSAKKKEPLSFDPENIDRNLLYAYFTLERNGYSFLKNSVKQAKLALQNNKITDLDFCWFLKTFKYVDDLKKYASENQYAQVYYFLHLADTDINKAFQYLSRYKKSLETMLVKFHNADDPSNTYRKCYYPIKMSLKKDALLPARSVKDSCTTLSLADTFNLEFYIQLKNWEKAREISEDIYKKTENPLSSLVKGGWIHERQVSDPELLFYLPMPADHVPHAKNFLDHYLRWIGERAKKDTIDCYAIENLAFLNVTDYNNAEKLIIRFAEKYDINYWKELLIFALKMQMYERASFLYQEAVKKYNTKERSPFHDIKDWNNLFILYLQSLLCQKKYTSFDDNINKPEYYIPGLVNTDEPPIELKPVFDFDQNEETSIQILKAIREFYKEKPDKSKIIGYLAKMPNLKSYFNYKREFFKDKTHESIQANIYGYIFNLFVTGKQFPEYTDFHLKFFSNDGKLEGYPSSEKFEKWEDYRRAFWTNGNLKQEDTYKLPPDEKSGSRMYDFVKHGIERTFYSNGQLMSIDHYEYGANVNTSKKYYKNGNIEFEAEYKNGSMDGTAKWYYKNGNLSQTTVYDNGTETGPVKEYYETGELFREYEITDNSAPGKTTRYYTDGTIRGEGTIVDGKLNSIYTFYYKNGNVEQKEFWDNGKLIKVKHYNKKGEFVDEEEGDIYLKRMKNIHVIPK